MEKDQKMYEIGYHLTPLVPEEKIDEEISVLRKMIEDKKGIIMNEVRPKMRKLAYAIKKLENAYFGWIKFIVDSEAIEEIEKSLKKSDKIVRFLIVKAIKEVAASSPARKISKSKKPAEVKEKVEIKPEEIDKKLEEIIKN